MQDKIYKLKYLPLFEQDLLDTVNYISKVLKNEEAAMRLINDVETAILVRLNNPVAFEPYHSRKKREYPYYRIYVRNYVIYYVVIDDVMGSTTVIVWCKKYRKFVKLIHIKRAVKLSDLLLFLYVFVSIIL